jgi:hypothetical protein
MEVAFCSNQTANSDNGTTQGYTTAGLQTWISTAGTGTGATIPSNFRTPSASIVTGANASLLTDTAVQDLLRSIYEQTGQQKSYDCIVGTALKRAFTNLISTTALSTISNSSNTLAAGATKVQTLLLGDWFSAALPETVGELSWAGGGRGSVALSDKLWVVCTGVFIGILALRFVAGLCIKLIERFPILESTSFVLIGYVGGLLLTELITHVHIGPLGKFIGIVIILALALLYAEIAGFQKVARPVLKIFVPIMKLVDFVVGGFFQLIFWPFKKAWSLVRR